MVGDRFMIIIDVLFGICMFCFGILLMRVIQIGNAALEDKYGMTSYFEPAEISLKKLKEITENHHPNTVDKYHEVIDKISGEMIKQASKGKYSLCVESVVFDKHHELDWSVIASHYRDLGFGVRFISFRGDVVLRIYWDIVS